MEPLQQPTVLILGAGAVGLSLAGKLHGVATACVACRQVHASAIVERGLVMEGVWGDRTVRGIRCVMGPEELPTSIDFIIITAKGTDTRAICEEYAAVIRDRPTATLQNGIGNEEIIAEYTDTVIGGTVTTNFSVLGPGTCPRPERERSHAPRDLVRRRRRRPRSRPPDRPDPIRFHPGRG